MKYATQPFSRYATTPDLEILQLFQLAGKIIVFHHYFIQKKKDSIFPCKLLFDGLFPSLQLKIRIRYSETFLYTYSPKMYTLSEELTPAYYSVAIEKINGPVHHWTVRQGRLFRS